MKLKNKGRMIGTYFIKNGYIPNEKYKTLDNKPRETYWNFRYESITKFKDNNVLK